MLEIWLQHCRRFGIEEVLLNLHAHADRVREFLEMRSDKAVQVTLVEEPTLLGSAGTIRANRDWVAGEECFWILYSDVLVDAGLDTMLAFHRAGHPVATLGVYPVPDPTRCGIVTLSAGNRVEKFIEKPVVTENNLAFSGLMLATPALLDAIPIKVPVDIGFDLLPTLCGQMLAYPLNNYVLDIGTPENYKLAQSTWPGM
jgi:mannose-1-phosphate guanylyltransferase